VRGVREWFQVRTRRSRGWGGGGEGCLPATPPGPVAQGKIQDIANGLGLQVLMWEVSQCASQPPCKRAPQHNTGPPMVLAPLDGRWPPVPPVARQPHPYPYPNPTRPHTRRGRHSAGCVGEGGRVSVFCASTVARRSGAARWTVDTPVASLPCLLMPAGEMAVTRLRASITWRRRRERARS
jgi:hypothetical protein